MEERGEFERQRRFGWIILIVFAVLSLRLWQLQLVRGEEFKLMAEGNRLRTIPIRAPRGSIYDRHGEVIATTRLAYTVSVVPVAEPSDDVIERLAGIIGMDPQEIRQILRRGGASPYEPIRIRRDVPIETVIAIEEERSRLPGVIIEDEWIRVYPRGEIAGHVVGYLGLASEEDIKAGYGPTDLVGKAGLELAYESFLKGQDGKRYVEVNALSRPIRELGVESPVPGMDLYLTLDLELQERVSEILAESLEALAETSRQKLAGAGAVVVLDPSNGDILAMASYPFIDPARLTGPERGEYVAALNRDPKSPWLNRAIRAFPPGSTFKVVTSAAILESGALTPDTVYNSTGRHKYGKMDWRLHSGLPPAGPVTIVEAIARSTNDFFWEFALRPETGGIEALADWARRFGLGEKTGFMIGESGEMSGTVPDPAWKRERYSQPWYEAETMDVAIGQGFLQVTPIQLAQAYMAVANRGTMYKPRLVMAASSPDGRTRFTVAPEVRAEIAAQPSTWQAITDGLRHVVQWPLGTGYSAFKGAEYDPAGKTGSAQTATAAHGWFAAFAPAHDPKVVVVVYAEHGESGTRSAEIARKIFDVYFGVEVEDDAGTSAGV